MTDIGQIIKEEIAKTGPISFARFMELALYCPDFGYYDQIGKSPGRNGDFYTSVSVGGLFGELLAWQFAGWLENTRDGHCQLLEAGAHDGRLAADILGWLSSNRPELFNRLEYWILEPSANRRKCQEQTLEGFKRHVRWFDSWNAFPSKVSGVIFGNELLDAMPVRQLRWNTAKNHWSEMGVAMQGNELIWTTLDLPDGNDALPNSHGKIPTELLAALPDEFAIEDSSATVQWWRDAARALETGKLLTIDYGLSADEFFTPDRRDGTLRAYHQHRQSKDLLARPGFQDLTAQVNFTAIQNAGEAAGLRTDAFISQAKFLAGIIERAGEQSFFEHWTPAQTRQFQTLTHPDHLGQRFRVLIQSRQP